MSGGSPFVIEFLAMAGEVTASNPPMTGELLAAYDPDAHDGRGEAEWTSLIDDALTFPTFTAASEFWRRTSVVRPVRDDGQPNRPLTACTVIVRRASDGASDLGVTA